MSYLVYLSGPISGLTYEDADDWRQWATRQLESDSKIKCLDPLRCKEFLIDQGPITGNDDYGSQIATSEFIGTRDYWDTTRADIVLVNLIDAKTVTIGTMLEIGMAKAAGVPIFLVMEEFGNIHEHPMVRNYAAMRFKSLSSAVAVLKAMLSV